MTKPKNEIMRSISDALEMNPLEQPKAETYSVQPIENNVDNDFEFARTNLKQIIDKGQSALDGILTIASGSEHPRAYEVAATLIKTMAETNKDLLELQKTKKILQQDDDSPKSVTNNLFVGSTAELQKMISKKPEEE